MPDFPVSQYFFVSSSNLVCLKHHSTAQKVIAQFSLKKKNTRITHPHAQQPDSLFRVRLWHVLPRVIRAAPSALASGTLTR